MNRKMFTALFAVLVIASMLLAACNTKTPTAEAPKEEVSLR